MGRRITEAAIATACLATYGACGTAGAFASPGETSTAHLAGVTVLAGAVVLAPPLLASRWIQRRGAAAMLLLGWSVLLACAAVALPRREERLAWPVDTAVALVPRRGAAQGGVSSSRSTTATPEPAASSSATGSPSAASPVDVRVPEPLAFPGFRGAVLRYAVAHPVSAGIAVSLSDTPIDCARSPSKALVLLTPDLVGGFFFGRAVPASVHLTTGIPGRAWGVDVLAQRFEPVAGARVVGTAETAKGWESFPTFAGAGGFSAVLCDDKELPELLEGWRAPVVRTGDLSGRVMTEPFVAAGGAAHVVTLGDGRKVLKRLELWNVEGGRCRAPDAAHTITVEPFSPLVAVTAGGVPASLSAKGPRAVKSMQFGLSDSHAAAVLEITRIDDEIEGTLTGWQTFDRYAPLVKTDRTPMKRRTEISGRFRVRRCAALL